MTDTERELARFITSEDLVGRLRKAASIWFKNSDLLLLEELIRRYNSYRRHEGVQ